jgi:plasmid stabilization system protein ParE
MAQRVIWSLEAAEDLETIAEYIERDSPRYAAVVVEKIVTLVRSLSTFPRMGRKVPEFDRDDLRERFVYSYRVIHQIRAETTHALLIYMIFHNETRNCGAGDLSNSYLLFWISAFYHVEIRRFGGRRSPPLRFTICVALSGGAGAGATCRHRDWKAI